MPSRCNTKLKESVITLYRCAGKHGVTQKRYCELIRLQPRRLQRWIRRNNLKDGQPGYLPGITPHQILTSEKAAILEYAKKEEYADMSHRVLAYMRFPPKIGQVVKVKKVLCSEQGTSIL